MSYYTTQPATQPAMQPGYISRMPGNTSAPNNNSAPSVINPTPRTPHRHTTERERAAIHALNKAGFTQTGIAQVTSIPQSTISRVLKQSITPPRHKARSSQVTEKASPTRRPRAKKAASNNARRRQAKAQVAAPAAPAGLDDASVTGGGHGGRDEGGLVGGRHDREGRKEGSSIGEGAADCCNRDPPLPILQHLHTPTHASGSKSDK
jgi:hypothetical protein